MSPETEELLRCSRKYAVSQLTPTLQTTAVGNTDKTKPLSNVGLVIFCYLQPVIAKCHEHYKPLENPPVGVAELTASITSDIAPRAFETVLEAKRLRSG